MLDAEAVTDDKADADADVDTGAAGVRRDYDRDGYVVLRGVLDAVTMAGVARHVDGLLARHPDRRGEDLGHDLIAADRFWVDLVADPRLLDVAELFVGPDLALFASHYICKPARSGRPVLWHQDAAYWPLEPMEVVTVWLAVDPSTSENGCLRVVPGSHRRGVHGRRQRPDTESVFGDESDTEVDERTVVDLELEPGDVEVHHPGLLHSSRANRSPNRRCGLTIRYIPTSTRIVTDDPPYASAFHLRGRAGVNEYQPWPTG